MKKISVIFVCICLVLPLLFCSCSGNSKDGSTSLSVTFSDGSNKTMTVKEIKDLSENDGRKYKEIEYIKGEGKVTSVGSLTEVVWKDSARMRPCEWEVKVCVNNDTLLIFRIGDKDDAPELYNGDMVEFSGPFDGMIIISQPRVYCDYQKDDWEVKLK